MIAYERYLAEVERAAYARELLRLALIEAAHGTLDAARVDWYRAKVDESARDRSAVAVVEYVTAVAV